MEDQLSKFIRLFANILLLILMILLTVVAIFVGLRFLMGALDYIPWLTYFYMASMLIMPACFFISVFVIFFKRTTFHPSAWVRGVSKFIFSAFILSWAVVFVLDTIKFFKKGSSEINYYLSYNLLFLVASIFSIFMIGVLQALTTEKEKDWLEKHQ